jgi:CheY-like chemotaxis protein
MSKKILLIEDDSIVRENTTEILELANYNVKSAENGKIGVALANSFMPDLIVCDILLPELDGYGVLQIISKSPKLEHIPFIFLTAKTDHRDIRKGMELGADDYINKPFEESELLRAIDSRLKRVEAFEHKKQRTQKQGALPYGNMKQIKNFEEYLAHKKCYNYKKGATIYCQGNQSSHIFLIKRGLVKTYKINTLGKELITGYFTNHQYFGYSSFARHMPHVENSMALMNTQLYKINKDEITAIINNNHHIIFSFMDLLAGNIIELKEQLLLMAYGSVRKRTAKTILKLLEKHPNSLDNKIGIKRKDLANTIGIAKETLIRTLHDFKEEKLIEVTPKNILIIDKKGLQNTE